MKSQDMKAAALQWLRFVRRYEIVCTEAGTIGLADVIGVCPTSAVEMEIKVSKADLRREFTEKAHKHRYYKSVSGGASPNYFYFMVPEQLVEAAVALALEHNPKYGVVSMPEGGNYQTLTVTRKAQRLHSEKPGPGMIRVATMRMSSELATLYAANRELAAKVVHAFEVGVNQVVQQAILPFAAEPDLPLETNDGPDPLFLETDPGAQQRSL